MNLYQRGTELEPLTLKLSPSLKLVGSVLTYTVPKVGTLSTYMLTTCILYL